MRTSAPTTTEDIEEYLGSGMIRGIGPVYAKKMVKAFGDGSVNSALSPSPSGSDGLGLRKQAKPNRFVVLSQSILYCPHLDVRSTSSSSDHSRSLTRASIAGVIGGRHREGDSTIIPAA
jgi:hypothetical protein